MHALLLIVLGVVILYAGGEVLVASVTRMATAFRVPPLVIGLTVVAFGTSSPEVAVAVGAGFANRPEIALGNVLGSNIANLGFILGVSALMRPVEAHRQLLRRDLPFLLAISVLLLPAAIFGGFGRVVGVVLVGLLLFYFWLLVRSSSRLELREEHASQVLRSDGWVTTLGALAGIALLIFGADVLVDAAVVLATRLGVSQRIIGLTLVAVGTSLPELAGCLVAARHGHGDIVVGNVTGSNIFNTLLVLPAAILVRPIASVPGALVDIGVMIGFTALSVAVFYRRGTLRATGGLVLVLFYVVYVAFLFAQG